MAFKAIALCLILIMTVPHLPAANALRSASEYTRSAEAKKGYLNEVYGSAMSYVGPSSNPIESVTKNYAAANTCYVSPQTTNNLNCTKLGVGTIEQVIPACCPSTSGTGACGTFDDASDILCSLSSRPYPACCATRNQPASICTVGTPGQPLLCRGQRPSFSCCSSTYCNALSQATNILYVCPAGQTNGCCPA